MRNKWVEAKDDADAKYPTKQKMAPTPTPNEELFGSKYP